MDSPFKNCNEKELDIVFTMLMSAAFGSDPWTTEDFLKEKGLIGKENRDIWHGGYKLR